MGITSAKQSEKWIKWHLIQLPFLRFLCGKHSEAKVDGLKLQKKKNCGKVRSGILSFSSVSWSTLSTTIGSAQMAAQRPNLLTDRAEAHQNYFNAFICYTEQPSSHQYHDLGLQDDYSLPISKWSKCFFLLIWTMEQLDEFELSSFPS